MSYIHQELSVSLLRCRCGALECYKLLACSHSSWHRAAVFLVRLWRTSTWRCCKPTRWPSWCWGRWRHSGMQLKDLKEAVAQNMKRFCVLVLFVKLMEAQFTSQYVQFLNPLSIASHMSTPPIEISHSRARQSLPGLSNASAKMLSLSPFRTTWRRGKGLCYNSITNLYSICDLYSSLETVGLCDVQAYPMLIAPYVTGEYIVCAWVVDLHIPWNCENFLGLVAAVLSFHRELDSKK